MFTVHRNGPIILPTRDNENHPHLECNEASLFHYPILQMKKMRPSQCFRSFRNASGAGSLGL